MNSYNTLITGLILTVFALFGILMFYYQYQAWRWGRASWGWPKAKGRILLSEATFTGSKGSPYSVKIKYEYTVADVQYTGSRYKFGLFSGTDKSMADRLTTRYKPGEFVWIYYHPERPRFAVLKPGISGLEYVAGFVVCGFIWVFWAFMVWSLVQ